MKIDRNQFMLRQLKKEWNEQRRSSMAIVREAGGLFQSWKKDAEDFLEQSFEEWLAKEDLLLDE